MRVKQCRRVAWSLLLTLLLCACGKQRLDPQQLAAYYTDRDLSAQYTVTTHAGLYAEYQLACAMTDGSAKVTILRPESVAGIAAVLQEGDIKLQYEELSLEALLPEVPGYAPMDVLHGLLEDLRTTAPDNQSLEKDRLTLEYRRTLTDGTESLKIVALHPETLDLQAAECYLDGSLILALQMESLQWEG